MKNRFNNSKDDFKPGTKIKAQVVMGMDDLAPAQEYRIMSSPQNRTEPDKHLVKLMPTGGFGAPLTLPIDKIKIVETYDLEEACWKGYVQLGTKKKDGKEVPNCVPKNKDIEEKAVSKSQQKLMGMALAYKRGDMDDASGEVKKLADSMTMKELEDFAKTKHKGLPDKVEEKKLDPVGKSDADIDNDGDVDSSDRYLRSRRKVITKAIKAKKEKQKKVNEALKNPYRGMDERTLRRKMNSFKMQLADLVQKRQTFGGKSYDEEINDMQAKVKLVSAALRGNIKEEVPANNTMGVDMNPTGRSKKEREDDEESSLDKRFREMVKWMNADKYKGNM